VGLIKQITRTSSALEQKFQREPSPLEIADALDITEAEVENTIRIAGKHVSVDAPFSQGEENNLLDVLETQSEEKPDTLLLVGSLKKEVARVLATLTARESEVLCDYYGLNEKSQLSLEEIADKFHLTRERVRQIKEKAIQRLRRSSKIPLMAYLG
jgi:RNA polymerase primary sigma factor